MADNKQDKINEKSEPKKSNKKGELERDPACFLFGGTKERRTFRLVTADGTEYDEVSTRAAGHAVLDKAYREKKISGRKRLRLLALLEHLSEKPSETKGGRDLLEGRFPRQSKK